MPIYPGRLGHKTPTWVDSDATFHIRISIARGNSPSLTDPSVAPQLMESARLYHESHRWRCRLFLPMPDHLHALLAFPRYTDMTRIIASWKGYHTKHLKLDWQANFFDHRIRNRHELEEKAAYIRLNPLRRGLCGMEDEWAWVMAGV